MNPVKKAKELVRNYAFPKDILEKIDNKGTYYDGKRSVYFKEGETVSNDILANSLSYYIDILSEEADENKIKLGASKAKGLPHLPKILKWPKGHFFHAQLNINDFKKYDLENVFPDSGIIYIFINPIGGSKILYYDGPQEDLSIIKYPNKKTFLQVYGWEEDDLEYLWEDYVNETSILTFKPEFIFYVGGDAYDYRDIHKLIPKDLKEQIAEILKAELTDFSSSNRIFGRPLYWQGEDEEYDWDEDFDDEEEDEDREVLIFHDEYGEGNIHVWMEEEDLKKKKFDQAHVDYSGT